MNFKQFFKIFSLLLVLFFITSISLFYIKDTFFKPFQISGNSMYPNFYNKEFILTNKSFSYDRFDTIVFHLPNSSHFYIKRIVGLPGESIKYENGNFYIGNINGDNFKLLENDYISKSLSIPNSDIYIIPENSYFVVGDNIDNSTDSLDCFGKCELGDDYVFMNSDNIVGKAYFDFGYYNMKTKFNNNGLDTKPRFFNIN